MPLLHKWTCARRLHFVAAQNRRPFLLSLLFWPVRLCGQLSPAVARTGRLARNGFFVGAYHWARGAVGAKDTSNHCQLFVTMDSFAEDVVSCCSRASGALQLRLALYTVALRSAIVVVRRRRPLSESLRRGRF